MALTRRSGRSCTGSAQCLQANADTQGVGVDLLAPSGIVAMVACTAFSELGAGVSSVLSAPSCFAGGAVQLLSGM